LPNLWNMAYTRIKSVIKSRGTDMTTITTLYTIHGHNDAKVQRVITDMVALGAPTIRVVDCGDHYMALEGCHRLEAASRLGVAPTLVVFEQDDLVDANSLDWPDLQAGESYTASELAAEAYSAGAGCYKIDEGRLELVFNGQFVPDFAG
jgi:hypothetical protein